MNWRVKKILRHAVILPLVLLGCISFVSTFVALGMWLTGNEYGGYAGGFIAFFSLVGGITAWADDT